ncbi:class E sortase [Streptomyces sp. NPDC048604]|uniref:class E sortase n=1 Tax=Streptomyces sp. NPDC048604 TaxID=3365578 RepID=UPI00371D2AC2
MQPQRIRGRVVVQRAPRTRSAHALWVAAEVAVTLGLVVLLLVVHQLWWTNHQARLGAQRQVQILEEEWGPADGPVGEPAGGSAAASPVPSPSAVTSPAPQPPAPRAPSLSSAYAVLRIPVLSLSVPVARGVSKRGVLDKGYVGHYPRTGRPGQAGNFALAGHRNTHGEPFRYVNRLRRGDEIRVRTREREYVYVVDQVLARTSPRDSGVIAPVPRSLVHPSAGYDTAGSYLTLTTCTPEFSSAYRLVVWAKLKV